MDTNTKVLENTPKVSILMLAYNRAQFIGEAIESVLAQTYQNWELIIIDDGSTDETPHIIATYTDPRIRFVRHEENAGLFQRRAESLSYATSTYTAVLDSDDFWTDTCKLSEQVAFLEMHPEHVLVGTFVMIVDTRGSILKKRAYETDDARIRRYILFRNQFAHSSVLMRTEALRKTAGYQPTLAEDLLLFLELGTIGKLANISMFGAAHRIHGRSENDRGEKMYAAIRSIVKSHRGYPYGKIAYILHTIRFLLSHAINRARALPTKQ